MVYYQTSNEFFSKNSLFSLKRYNHGAKLHWHNAIEFMYILKGKLEISMIGRVYTANPGDIVAVNSAVVHETRVLDPALNYYVLIVNEEFFKTNKLYGDKTFFMPIVKTPEARRLFNTIVEEFTSGDELCNVAIASTLMSFFVYMRRNYNCGPEQDSPIDHKKMRLVRKVLNYIQENYKKKITIDELSEELHFSRSYLSHVFKEITRLSLIQYINLVKCQQAQTLLLRNYSISEAAAECGFTELSYFTRVFKKTIGALPSSVNKEIFTIESADVEESEENQ